MLAPRSWILGHVGVLSCTFQQWFQASIGYIKKMENSNRNFKDRKYTKKQKKKMGWKVNRIIGKRGKIAKVNDIGFAQMGGKQPNFRMARTRRISWIKQDNFLFPSILGYCTLRRFNPWYAILCYTIVPPETNMTPKKVGLGAPVSFWDWLLDKCFVSSGGASLFFAHCEW